MEKLRLGGRVVQLQSQPFLRRLQAHGLAYFGTQLAQGKIGLFKVDGTFVQLGRIQNIVEQPQQRQARLAHRAQLLALGGIERTVEQHLAKTNDGVHGGANFMAHVGQETAADSGGHFGPLFGLAQGFLHGMAFAQIGGEFHNFENLALGIKNGGVRAQNPYPAAPLGHPQELPQNGLALAQLRPACGIARGLQLSFGAKILVVQAQYLVPGIAHHAQVIVIGTNDVAV